jgi:hypothetical protein
MEGKSFSWKSQKYQSHAANTITELLEIICPLFGQKF